MNGVGAAPRAWSVTAVAACLGLVLLAGVSLVRPEWIGDRFAFEPRDGVPLGDFRAAARAVAGVLWAPLLAAAGILILGRTRAEAGWTRGQVAAVLVLALLGFLGAADALRDWMVDDAGITFSYSRNLAEGHGLVVRPGYPPEEAYSNTSWMLLLSAAHLTGGDIPTTAKLGALACGAAAALLALWAVVRLSGRRADGETLVLVLAILLGAPLLVWSASGLEHGLQALLLCVAATAPLFAGRRPEVPAGAALAVLVLTRPEAALLLACLALAFLLHLRAERAPRRLARTAVLVVPSVVCGLGLLVFRLAYFGDPLPNPFYAKAHDASFLRLVNLPGSGWRYVLDWASSAGALVLLPFLLVALAARPLPLAVRQAAALVAGQLVFVVSVAGDWMKAFRFVAPVLPLVALLVAHGCGALRELLGARQRLLSGAAAATLGLFGTIALIDFRAAPTTPFERVGRIGLAFADLAERMGIEHPTLGHHDAGGTTYTAELDIVDLAGLCDRTLAKHARDAPFLRDYLLDEKRPSFFFGVTTYFAALRSRFHEDPRFLADYVPVQFPERPWMESGLCHVRRELVRPSPGLEILREDGVVTGVVVAP